MKVILEQDVKGQGKKGDLVNVSDGYARNYLIPRGLAKEATADAMNAIKIADAAKKRRIEQERAEAKALAERLSGMPVKLKAKAGAGGRLFGSVTAKEIADGLKEQHGVEIAKNKILLEDNIKSFGSFEIKVRLYPEITGTLYVVVAEEASH